MLLTVDPRFLNFGVPGIVVSESHDLHCLYFSGMLRGGGVLDIGNRNTYILQNGVSVEVEKR